MANDRNALEHSLRRPALTVRVPEGRDVSPDLHIGSQLSNRLRDAVVWRLSGIRTLFQGILYPHALEFL